MSLQAFGNILVFVFIYIGVFYLLVQFGVYAAFVIAFVATQWVKKNFK